MNTCGSRDCFMNMLFLFGAVICSALLSITSNTFNMINKTGRNFSTLYNLIVTLSSFVFWTLTFFRNPEFSAGVLLYSVLFGVFYALAFIGMFNAIANGSPSLTAFMKPLSLIAVSLWGIAFWNNPISNTFFVGLILVIFALWLCFKHGTSSSVNVKWLLFSLLLIVGNAGCSIVQKYQQIEFNGQYGNLLMFGATAFSVVFCSVLHLRGKSPSIKELPKYSIVLPVVAGLSSALLNVCVLRLVVSSIPENTFFPIIGVGGVIFATLFSVCVYKEKLTLVKWTGLCIGIVAIVFLNIR